MGEDIRAHAMWLGALLATVVVPLVKPTVTTNSKAHSRQKRLLWLTSDGRLALPPGTALVISPTLTMPFVRYPPEGFLSNMSISLPFSINFDKLGLTDNQNPYGVLPPILGRSLGRSAGSLVADYIAQVMDRRTKREALTPPPEANFHGGERAILYRALEDMISNFGLDGRACLLRAVCEVHGRNIQHFGLIGEFVKLFFTASQSPFSHLLQEYVDAEEAGVHDGECWKYHKLCPKSIFAFKQENKYRKDDTFHEGETDLGKNTVAEREDITNVEVEHVHLE